MCPGSVVALSPCCLTRDVPSRDEDPQRQSRLPRFGGVVDEGDVNAAFNEMALSVHAEATLDETLDRVLEFAVSAVQCGYAAVILLGQGGKLDTVAATDPVVAKLDLVQAEFGQGPDLDLVDKRLGVLVSDTRLDTRWPEWSARAADLGVRSMLGTRLYTDDDIVGTLNLYDRHPNHFDVDDQAVAHVMARHAAAALARSRTVENLWQAIDARKRIGQAQGILMERYQLDEDQAFHVLMRYSQDKNIKLRAVAEKLIQTRELPGH